MPETIDSLVTRLGRCVGGKLADDVAAAVKEMKAQLDRAIEENSSMTDATNAATERVRVLESELLSVKAYAGELDMKLAEFDGRVLPIVGELPMKEVGEGP